MAVSVAIEGILWRSLAVFKYVLYRVNFTYSHESGKVHKT